MEEAVEEVQEVMIKINPIVQLTKVKLTLVRYHATIITNPVMWRGFVD